MYRPKPCRLLAPANTIASYATRDLDIQTRIPTRVRLPMHANLLVSCVEQ